jgi:hypothetical protein
LVRDGFPRVAVLMGGMDAIRMADEIFAGRLGSPSNNITTTPTMTNSSNNGPKGLLLQGNGNSSIPSINARVNTSYVCTCKGFRTTITSASTVNQEVVVVKCKRPLANMKAKTKESVGGSNGSTISQRMT